MNSILLILLGVALGFVIGWLVAAARTRTEMVKFQVDAEGRVKAAEGTLQEVRVRLSTLQATLDGRERESAGLQQKLRDESEQKVKAQTELENARVAAADSNQLRERLKAEGELRVAAETKLRQGPGEPGGAEKAPGRRQESPAGGFPGALCRGAQEQ